MPALGRGRYLVTGWYRPKEATQGRLRKLGKSPPLRGDPFSDSCMESTPCLAPSLKANVQSGQHAGQRPCRGWSITPVSAQKAHPRAVSAACKRILFTNWAVFIHQLVSIYSYETEP